METTSRTKFNITSIFMVPTLQIPRNVILKNGFINAYIKDEMNAPKYEDCIFLLFHPDSPSKFRKFLNSEYERTKAILDDYDYKNGFVVVVYKLNSGFALDFELVKQSQYSKTSKDFQNQFSELVEVEINGVKKMEKSLQYQIFNKTSALKKWWEAHNCLSFVEGQEIWHRFVEANEILTETKLKDLIWNKFQED